MKDQKIDFLAFTGHKDLMAIPGVGGFCCESTEHIEPFVQGGTGIHERNILIRTYSRRDMRQEP